MAIINIGDLYFLRCGVENAFDLMTTLHDDGTITWNQIGPQTFNAYMKHTVFETNFKVTSSEILSLVQNHSALRALYDSNKVNSGEYVEATKGDYGLRLTMNSTIQAYDTITPAANSSTFYCTSAADTGMSASLVTTTNLTDAKLNGNLNASRSTTVGSQKIGFDAKGTASLTSTSSFKIPIFCTDQLGNYFISIVPVDWNGEIDNRFDMVCAFTKQSAFNDYMKNMLKAASPASAPWILDRFSPRLASNGLGVYPLTGLDVQNFFANLWNNDLMTNFVRTILGDPVEAVVSLRYFFGLTVDDMKIATTNVHPKLGNVSMNGAVGSSKAITTKPCLSEYASKTLSISCPAKFDNYLDFAPFTKVNLWVPFVGWIELEPNDVIGSDIDLEYNVNLITGAASVNIIVRNNPRYKTSGVPIANLNCSMSVDIPISVQRMQNILVTSASLAAKAGSLGFTTGIGIAGAGAMAGNIAAERAVVSAENQFVPGTAYDVNSSQVRGLRQAYAQRNANEGNAGTSIIANPFRGNFGIARPGFARSSSMTPESANLNLFRAMLLISRPKKLTPTDIADYYGSKSVKSVKLSTCKGFTQIAAIKNKDVVSGKYLNKIEMLLKTGVYFK